MVLQNELKDASRIPLKDRLAWTIPQAASLYGIDYDGLRQPPTGCQPGRHRHVSSAKQTRNAFPPSHQARGDGPIRQIVGGVSMNDIRKEL